MKNRIKKNLQQYLQIALLLFIPFLSGAQNPSSVEISCPGPQVSVTGQSGNSASFSWSPVSGASNYIAYYYRHEDRYSSSQTTTSNTSITFAGLPAGTYSFYFATVCGSELSNIIIVTDLVL